MVVGLTCVVHDSLCIGKDDFTQFIDSLFAKKKKSNPTRTITYLSRILVITVNVESQINEIAFRIRFA